MLLRDLTRELEQDIPLSLAASWDNVGLLVGSLHAEIHQVMTTLDVTPSTLREAIDLKADLIVTHHPLPFRPIQSVTTKDLTGDLICQALRHGINVYSNHTAWDNAVGGINDQLAAAMNLTSLSALEPDATAQVGSGRRGEFSTDTNLAQIFELLGKTIGPIQPRANMAWNHRIESIGICCGSGGSMLPRVMHQKLDALLTGEATYHQCLEAHAAGISLLMIGHHCSEQFAMKKLAERIATMFHSINVWSCRCDQNIIIHHNT